ncbi:MAG: damage-inducible protein [Betaproteobacteria bacterium]|nr:damage-inducible protein [Betaproteobacteria bacterium]
MQDLMPLAEQLGARLKARNETIAVAESAAGGLIAASLLAMPGASAYFIGGTVVYTYKSRAALLGISEDALTGMRPSTEPYALLLARHIRERLGSSWGIAETGAAGPKGNRYGDAAGHACVACVGAVEASLTIETGSTDRAANMRAFAAAAMELLLKQLG